MNNRKIILEKLIADEWPKLRRFFHTKVPASDIEDLAQSTFLVYVDGAERGVADARAYLWGIARKQVLKYYERHRRQTEPFDSSLHSVMDLAPSLSSRLDKRNRVIAALQTLPVDHQDAFLLHYGEELRLEEVAKALGVSLSTVKRHIAKAEEKLRAELGDDAARIAANYQAL